MDPLGYFRRRWERQAPPDVRDLPWWLPIYTAVSEVAVTAGAAAQRIPGMPTALLTLAIVLCISDAAATVAGKLLPWPAPTLTYLGGVGLLLAHPNHADIAPVLLILASGKMTATYGWRVGAVATGVFVALLLAGSAEWGVWGVGVYVVGVLLGFDVGFTMRWQMRALTSERARLAAERDHAAAAERQRIAADVHDLVAHSPAGRA